MGFYRSITVGLLKKPVRVPVLSKNGNGTGPKQTQLPRNGAVQAQNEWNGKRNGTVSAKNVYRRWLD